ncbi:hypothetical protein SMCF_1354, partial [Streptomyces coelicoflavus ZG0656]
SGGDPGDDSSNGGTDPGGGATDGAGGGDSDTGLPGFPGTPRRQ